MKYDRFRQAVNGYLSKILGDYNVTYTNSSIFGQMLSVIGNTVQNMFTYIEDAIMEQNKVTATRRKSIYGLAAQSGYDPSLGTATTATIRLTYIPNNESDTSIILPNKTKVRCDYNGLTYNILLPQEAIVLNPRIDNTSKYLNVVQGTFEKQTFVSTGGNLYTINLVTRGDTDLEYMSLKVNNEEWERVADLYDMNPDGKQYVAKSSLKDGIDLIFGNSQFGRPLNDGDTIEVEYLLHDGEYGNIVAENGIGFTFQDKITDTSGFEVAANNIILMTLETQDDVSSGTFSDDLLKVREMIGYNSRSLVLADPKNYKLFLSRFSFVGYNRTWSEEGSIIINSLITKNNVLTRGRDYFLLHESDFRLSDSQKSSIRNAISKSHQSLAGSIYNIFDPELVKYAMFMYVKLKDTTYDTDYITNKIRDLVGNFFHDIHNDIFIPKSDIIQLIKNNVEEVDGIDIYILCQKNEQALIDHHYEEKIYNYNPARGTYDIRTRTVYLYDGENPNLGLDEHGNIYLDNADQIPVLMGDWKYKDGDEEIGINDPLTIIYK